MANGIPTLEADRESLQTLRDFWLFTLARLISDQPNTTSWLPPYQAFGTKLDACIVQETSCSDAIVLADAKVVAADAACNVQLDLLSALIHGGKKPVLTLPKHILYFGNLSPSDARAFNLGPQLDLMSNWPGLLAKETDQAYLDLIPGVTDAVNVGLAAKQGAIDARLANAKFRLTGPRAQLFDDYNGLAVSTFGAMSSFAHANPGLKLPTEWAYGCFKHVTRDPGPQTLEEVDAALAKLKDATDKLTVLRGDLVTEAQALATAKANMATAAANLKAAKAAKDAADKAAKDAEKAAKDAEKAAKAAKKKK
jgi:hypothetical protein